MCKTASTLIHTFKNISTTHHRNDIPTMESSTMSLHCPSCGSPQVSTHLTAMRIAAFIGMLGGALRGAGTILLTGPAVTNSTLAKPPNVNLNALSSAILNGLVGAAGGCAMGVKVEHGEQGRFDEAERVILTLDESRSWHAAAQRGVFGTMPTCMPKGLNTLFNV